MFKILNVNDISTEQLKVEGEVACIDHTSVHPELAPAKRENEPTGERIQLRWYFDYENVSRAELIELATKHLVIAKRTEFKKIAEPDHEDWNGEGATFKVRDYLDNERKPRRDKVATTRKMIEGLSEQQRAELLKALQQS